MKEDADTSKERGLHPDTERTHRALFFCVKMAVSHPIKNFFRYYDQKVLSAKKHISDAPVPAKIGAENPRTYPILKKG